MSHKVNDITIDDILEMEIIVQYHRDFWSGKLWDYILEREYEEAKKTLDTKIIDQLLKDSSAEMFDLEYRPNLEEYKLTYPLGNIGWNLDSEPF